MKLDIVTIGFLVLINTFSVMGSGNIASINNGGGSFCFKQIPRKSLPGNCTLEKDCRDFLDLPYNSRVNCGNYGECVTETTPKNELCKDACENSICGKMCLQLYSTKTAKYCIRARDHPNVIHQGLHEANRYHCICTEVSFYGLLGNAK